MKKSLILGSAFLVSFSFLVASAQTSNISGGITTLASLVSLFTSTLVKSIGTLLMAAAVVAFFWGLIEYIWGSREGNTEKIHKGNTFIMYSLIALFVMFSVYGIIKFGQNIFFSGQDITTINIPEINFKSSGTGSTGTGGTGGTGTGSNTSCTLGICVDPKYQCTPNISCEQNGLKGTCNNSGTSCITSAGQTQTGGTSGTYECVPNKTCTTSSGAFGYCAADGQRCLTDDF